MTISSKKSGCPVDIESSKSGGMKHVTVVFAADQNYIAHVAVALVSLLINNPDLDLSIFLICSNVTETDFDKVKRIARRYSAEIQKIEVTDEFFDRLVVNLHFTKATYYRLLISKVIDAEYVLYLDCDIVVRSSIRDLCDVKLGDKYVAAVQDPGFDRHTALGMRPESLYFNSGVMLINCKKWREDNLSERVIRFINDNPQAVKFVDQCGLNAIIDGRWLQLPLKYNQQAGMFKKNIHAYHDCFSTEEIHSAKTSPVIVHYTTQSKPWHFSNKHPFKNLYWKYLRLTPFRRLLPQDFNAVTLVHGVVKAKRKSIKKLFRKSLYAISSRENGRD